MKSIAYDKYTDLRNCADEPIHILGKVQCFGYLAVFNTDTNKLAYISENLLDKLQVAEEQLLEFTLQDLYNEFKIKEKDLKIPVEKKQFQWGTTTYIIRNELRSNLLYIEIEPLGKLFSTDEYVSQTGSFINLINKAEDFNAFAHLIANNIQSITGYDRVMVYKFDNDFNGEVIAEKLVADKESYLGLNYPHTDIPEQARKLYKKDHCRILEDVQAKPIPILSTDSKYTHKDLDLTGFISRASSPIHIEYLKNMGVRSTMTISIMIGEQLWGLIACHHYNKKHIGIYVRKAALLQTQFFASQIKRWERSDEYALVQEKEHIYQAIVEEGVKHKDLFKAITNQTYLLGLTSSQGGAVIKNDEILTFGQSLKKEQIKKIHRFMKSKDEHVFLTNTFSEYYELAKEYKELVSGVLYYRLDMESNNAIMWFRPQQSEGKKWGGDPREILKSEKKALTPRNSFAAWEENVSGKSEIWRSYEIQAGLRLCAFLEREIYIKSLKEQKHIFESLTQELRNKNEELNQFNWISSHDMKEPLRKIRLFVDQIKSEEDKLTTNHQMYFERIDVAASYMQNLINDLLNYSSLNKQESFENFKLSALIKEVIQTLDLDSNTIHLDFEGDYSLLGIKFQVRQLLVNLISNSMKFKHPDRNLEIKVQLTVVQKEMNEKLGDYLKLRIADNGIGFSAAYKDKIFQVFQRLHNNRDYAGTGIGLAICRKVMETHNGFLVADAEEGKGAQFSCFFPI